MHALVALLFVTSLACTACATLSPFHRKARYRGGNILTEDLRASKFISSCDERWRDTRLDHFSWTNDSATTFKQRYFVCDTHWKPGGVIFFYLGNEADVTLYLNNTGLMVEMAPRHQALIVFAEHRYYGLSKPFPDETLPFNMGYLTTEQAMADYASLIWQIKTKDLEDPNVPVIGFGGSYGGMLATWFRMKYPHLIDGAIAASAPIWSFFGEDPPYNPGGFAEAVAWDASEDGGSAAACVPNARKAWQTMFDWGGSEEGRAGIARAMRLCGSDLNEGDVGDLADWAQDAWAYLAMGDYPYESSYILNGEATLPAYPVRVACENLKDPKLEGEALLGGMADAVGLFYNASGKLECFDFGSSAGNATEEDATFWDFQYCTEQFMPQSMDGIHDMFWSKPVNVTEERIRCQETWGVVPSRYKATIEWGGRRIEDASNIVFSNGGRDPWRAGGVLQSLSKTLVAVQIPEGAHHLDLMYSNKDDPESVIEARKLEEEHIMRWIEEARERGRQRKEWKELQQQQEVELVLPGRSGNIIAEA